MATFHTGENSNFLSSLKTREYISQIQIYMKSNATMKYTVEGETHMINQTLSDKQCLEFSKKIAVLRRLVQLDMISTDEYILCKNKIMDSYHITADYFHDDKREKVA